MFSWTIEALRDQIDRYRAAEWELCQALGGWSGDDDDPVARREFAAASARHAWHLQLWDERRPQINTVDPPPAPSESIDGSNLASISRTADRRRHAELAIDRLATRYRQHANEIDALVDPATAETLRRILT
ncbi:MAG TPA: hypothetical protein PKV27_11185 [Ilumatobacteraceae bacterium]|nr:hypothetical protein [Ilumatobacteraceae bacterium]